MQAQYPDRGSSRLRQGRFSTQGTYYFITTRTSRKQRIFEDPACVRVLFECLVWLESRGLVETLFCIAMPDHVHIVLHLCGNRSLSQVMKSLKGYSSRRILSAKPVEGPVWQDQYYEHAVRKDEDLSEIIKYCWFNPVRSGLVADPVDYPHWTSRLPLSDLQE